MIVRFRWFLILSSFLSVFWFASIAQASELVFWRFERDRNRLVFTTDEGVQPEAQLIANPTRVVIDLPGITLGRPTVNQAMGGTIREVRVGQFNERTTRIVIELAPGYTLDPQQVKFRGISPSQWTVDLPAPERIQESSRQPDRERPRSSTAPDTTLASGAQARAEVPEATALPVPEPNPVSPPAQSNPPAALPRVLDSRLAVLVDPSHGGKDPGTIGIGGVQDGRVQMAQRSRANLFVSIHANAISLSRPDINGLETYYYSSGQRLAQTGREDAARLANSNYRQQMAEAIARSILQYIQRTS
jgi:N-acetylmuramoyl-L-alanine amidase